MSKPLVEVVDPLHQLSVLLHNIDVGVAVVDRQYRVQLWNGFMENHSGQAASEIAGQALFEAMPDLPREWLQHKLDMVFDLEIGAYTTWEQRPYLFRFGNYRPVTGDVQSMYQDITFLPLPSLDSTVAHVAIVVYDTTDIATNKRKLESANSELSSLSRTDALTGLYNRGYWEERLSMEFTRFQRSGEPCALVLFDIDHFKAVNDTHGHQAGDEVIRQVAATVARHVRAVDIPGRYGGEEFGVVLIGAPASGAQVFAERLRRQIEQSPVRYNDRSIAYTVSLGIAEFSKDMRAHGECLERADRALYTAKRGGRNRACLAGADDPSPVETV